ncbi:2-dehydropantoate 2-reductase [Soonwooa sp.]|uniref:2-dehydropantoate 2-reductase n=1 Tax=Soonwooa sp. TaxID=1938592 RepID=UPI002624A164|nr:2-dehydropantoate 2-reductase [Soonwooa sp.]
MNNNTINRKEINVSVVGTGAIGGFYGIMLAQLGYNVHFLLHSDYDYVKENGLTLASKVFGEIKLPKVNAYKNAKDMPVSDIVLVALKTTQNKNVLPEVLPEITDENSSVIFIQNGLGMEEEAVAMFPNLHVAGAVALIGSRKEKNGIIIHETYGAIDFGNFNLKNDAVLQQLANDFNSVNIPSTVQNLKELRWKKLLWNTTFNGLSVVTDSKTDDLLKYHLPQAKEIMQEVRQAAKLDGVDIPEDFIDGMILFTEKMDSYAPSMKVDYDRGNPLELEYLYERPISKAYSLGFEMEKTTELYKHLTQLTAVKKLN